VAETQEVVPTPEELLGFNPFDPEFRRDPYPVYKELRQRAPVLRTPFGMVVASRYAECASLTHDPRFSSDQRNSAQYKLFVEQQRAAGTPVDESEFSPSFLFLDAPDHTRLRGLVSKAFTARRIENLRPRIQEFVDELIDAHQPRGSMEVIEDLAFLLPVTIISEMLGVPSEDADTFKAWSRELARSLDPEIAVPPEVIERRQKASESFRDYFQTLIAKRRGDPQDDLLSALIAAEDGGDKLTELELLSTCVLILIAGHETTVNLIGNGVLQLLRHPVQLERLRSDPSLVKPMVEEVLRFDPPVQFNGRIALEDTDVAGETIHAGEMVITLIGSANRDPGHFPDADTFDIARAPNAHIAFSTGPHFCLGAALARLEGQIALQTLVDRVPNLRLATDAIEYKENIVLRGLAALPVTF
jgi:hypothetical protein